MEERPLRTLHPAPTAEDLCSLEQRLQQITHALRQLRAENAALAGQVAQLSKVQSDLAAQVRQLRADNAALRAAGSVSSAPSQNSTSSRKPAPAQKPAPAAPPQAKKRPMLARFSDSPLAFGSDWLRRDQVASITFLDTLSGAPADAWDISLKRDRSALAWAKPKSSLIHHLYIAGEGGVTANPDASFLFAYYSGLKHLSFDGNFDISHSTNLRCMFAQCSSLSTLDLSGVRIPWGANTGLMFYRCDSLTPGTRQRLRAQGFPI